MNMIDTKGLKVVALENRVRSMQPAMLLHNEENDHLYMVTITPDLHFSVTDGDVVGARYDLNFELVDDK